MFLMTKKNIIDIYNGDKTITLRPLKDSGKGYFKVGSVQRCKLNFFDDYFLKVKILERYFISIDDLTAEHINDLGYASKEEYLDEKFNRNNDSVERVLYKFQVVEVNKIKMKELL